MRICIVTCGVGAAEPRVVKQALALRHALPHSEIMVCDAIADGVEVVPDPEMFQEARLSRHRRTFPTRRSNLVAWAANKTHVAAARARWHLLKQVSPAVFGIGAVSLAPMLLRTPAHVYIAHGIDTLLPVTMAAGRYRAKIVFDSMEYYSDMGGNQTNAEIAATRALQASALRECALVFTASDEIADALVRDYAIGRPVPLYNTPMTERELPPKNSNEFSLYWRNYQIGFGQRGLEDALVALSMLPSDIKLYLQGKMPVDGGAELRSRITKFGLKNRVVIKPPFRSDQAVRQAAPHTVGLCLERRGPANHEYTVSNKLFDYMMGGLAVVSADLKGLQSVIKRSGGGVLFEPGRPQSLAAVILELYQDRERTRILGENARAFALTEANNEIDMIRFVTNFKRAILKQESFAPPYAEIGDGRAVHLGNVE